MYKLHRYITAYSLRAVCINLDMFDAGDNEEYAKLAELNKGRDHDYKELTLKHAEKLARYIVDHSAAKSDWISKETAIANVMSAIFDKAVNVVLYI